MSTQEKVPITSNSPAQHAAAIVPSDSTTITTTRSVHLGTAGNLRVTMSGGEVVTYYNLAAGWHPLSVSRIWSTGTTASLIVAVW
jgi:hypothetical protein